jgi:NAD(P)-dependent dehydrogenase (short-subunit alcohol dehydrogenase family)
LTKSAALDYAGQNIRLNAVAPGYIATAMMERFTGGADEGWAKVVSEEPIGRMGEPEKLPMLFFGFVQMRLLLSSDTL